MSESSGPRRSRRRQLQASHQKNWLVGRYAVLEVLKAGRWPITELLLADDLDEGQLAEVRGLLSESRLRPTRESRDRLTQLCHAEHHQGYVARMGDYPYQTVESLLKEIGISANESTGSLKLPPLLVLCDRIQDAHNFGAILRSCDAMRVDGVIIGQTEQVGVTPQVARSSAGAVNSVKIATCDDPVQIARQLREHGFQLAAASEKSSGAVWDSDMQGPVCLVIGSEAVGIHDDLFAVCGQHLRIPMLGQVESLNAAVAAGILLYEIRRQQMSAV
ncbi:MAG: RNA methyltransferase [Planctomycetaceae bacterium]